jgi:cobalt-zinc-cadmium efflux system membrane fusion protein
MLERLHLRTEPVVMRALPAELQTTGEVDFEQDRLAHVTPRIPGRVEEVHADLGQNVRKGQVLAWIDSIELGKAKSEFLQAQSQEELARQNFEREKGLFGERIASEKEMLAARAAHLEAIARRRTGEETLRLYGLSDEQIRSLRHDDDQASLLPVRAPLSGRVVEKHVTVGELVTPEREMFTIADLEHVWIWIDVYERDLERVHLEDDVAVAVEAYAGEVFRGKVSYLSDQVDADTRTVRARIDVDNPQHRLRPGMFARVTLSDPHIDATGMAPSLVVPAGAVQRDGDAFIVFVALGDDRYARHEVSVGRTAAGFVEIRSGLAPTDTVVVEGAFLLKSEASKEEIGGGHAH